MTARRAVSDLGVAIAAVELPHRTGLVVKEDVAEAGPRWLSAVEVVQRAEQRLAPVAADALLVAGVVLLLGGSFVEASVGAAAFALAGWLGPLYRKRSVVETQGVGWYLSALALPLLALTVAVSLVGPVDTRRAVSVVSAGVVLGLAHSLLWLIVARTRRAGIGLRPALLVGPPERTKTVSERIEAYPAIGLRVAATLSPVNTNGQRSRARTLLEQGAISQILITSDVYDDALIKELDGWRRAQPVDIAFIPPVAAADSRLPRVGYLDVVPLGRTDGARGGGVTKRLLDIVLSSVLLVLLAPVLAIVSVAIYLHDRGPVLYRQRRVGRDNEEFTIFKFRSMVVGADRLTGDYAHANVSNGLLFKVPNDPRVTPVGDLIRRLSIDELPQLVNVLIGDMSLVGPRPLPVDPDAFDEVAAGRHRVRPGITGPWQVAGGHVLGYDDMIKLDLAYVHSWSFGRDLWYLLMTIPAILVRRAAY